MTNLTISVKENSMTKPEGPAQEPHNHANLAEILMCEKCCAPSVVAVLAAHGRIVVPTTPAPSQPAREWFMARRKMDAYISFDDMEEYAQFVARQQTAAKDAEIRMELRKHLEQADEESIIGGIRNLAQAAVMWKSNFEKLEELWKAAERERDSLREANARLAADLDAALKAGKDGQK